MSYLAYVVNAGSNTVSVINVSTGAIISTIAVGNSPRDVTVTPDGTKAYVTNIYSNSVSVVNVLTGVVTATIAVGNSPYGVTFTPDGTKAYVANNTSNNVSVINVSTGAVTSTIAVGTYPWDVAITPDGTKAYVVSDTSVSVINVSAGVVTATITGTAISQLRSVTFTPDGTKAYVASNSGQVIVINVSTGAVTAIISAGSIGAGIAITPDGTKAYYSDVRGNAISVINVSTGTVTSTIAVGNSARGIAFTSDGTKAYVTNTNDNTISVINVSTGAVTGTIAVGTYPWDVAFTNDLVPPSPLNASINPDGVSGVLNCKEDISPPVLQGSGFGSTQGLTLSGLSGGAVTLSAVSTTGTQTVFSLSRTVYSAETGALLAGLAASFTDSASPANSIIAFSALRVTNNSVVLPPDVIAPGPQNANINSLSSVLTLNWAEAQSSPVVQNAGATLTLIASGGSVTLSGVSTSGTITTAYLSRFINSAETLTLGGSVGGWQDSAATPNLTAAFSGLSVKNNVTPSAPLAPPAVTFGTPPRLNYSWSAPSSGAPTTYNVYEGGYAGGETFLAQVAGTVTTYSHNASPGNYAAYVTAVNTTGEGPRTNEITITVPIPTTCVSSLTSGFNVNIPAPSSGATSFNLQRALDAAGAPGAWTTIATPVAPSAVFTDTGLNQGTKYWYRLQAVNAAGVTAGTAASCTTASAPDFSLSIATTPVQVVAGGSAVTDVISLTSLNAYTNSFTLTISGLPTGVSGTISPVTQTLAAGGTSTATLTLSAPLSATLVSGQVATITASSGTLTRTLSLPISVTVPPPAAPTGLIATPGDTIVTLTYPVPASGTTLSLYRGTAAGAESTTAIATGQTSGTYVNSALTNGTTYFYYAKNVLSGATSTQSIEVSATPIATAPLTIAINSPATGTTAVGVVTFTVQTSGGVGGVQRVELYVQGSIVGTVTVPTSANIYTITWDTRPGGNGVYGAYAKAYDYKPPTPNIAVSSTISLTVNNPVPPAVQYFYTLPFTPRAGKNIKLAAATCRIIPSTDSRTNKIITFGYNPGGASFNFDADYIPQALDREFAPVTNTGAAAASDTMRFGFKLSALYSISPFTFTQSITKMLPMTLATGTAGLLVLTAEPKLYTFDGVSSPVLLLDLTTLPLAGETVSDIAVFQSRIYISLSGGAAPIPTRLYVFDNAVPDESFSIVPPFTSPITCLASTATTLYAGTQSGKVHTVSVNGALAVLVPKTTAGLPYPISRLFPLPLAGANTTPGIGAATSDGSLWDIDTTDTAGNNAKLAFSPPDGTTTGVLSAAIAPDASPLTTSTKYLGTGGTGNIFTYAAGGTTYALAYVAPFPVVAMASYAGTIYFGGAGDARLWGKVLSPAAHSLAYSAVTDPITGVTGINCMATLTVGTVTGLYIGCATSSGGNTLLKFQAPTANAAAVYGKQVSDVGYTTVSYA